MNDKMQLALMETPTSARVYNPKEFKLVPLRECTERDNFLVDTPEAAADYYRRHVTSSAGYNLEVENMTVLFVNTRRRVKGHMILSNGTLDTILINPREAFRAAIVMNSAAVIFFHNHPSGDPTPSEGDIKATRDLMRAGQLLKIEVLDHIIMGERTAQSPKDFSSLRELGYFVN